MKEHGQKGLEEGKVILALSLRVHRLRWEIKADVPMSTRSRVMSAYVNSFLFVLLCVCVDACVCVCVCVCFHMHVCACVWRPRLMSRIFHLIHLDDRVSHLNTDIIRISSLSDPSSLKG